MAEVPAELAKVLELAGFAPEVGLNRARFRRLNWWRRRFNKRTQSFD
jgi:hypothetical protein